MFYKQMPVKITGYGLAAGCQVFYRKIYGFFYSVGLRMGSQLGLRCVIMSRFISPIVISSILAFLFSDFLSIHLFVGSFISHPC